MRVSVKTKLPVGADLAWKAVTNPAFLAGLSEPLIRLESSRGDALPAAVTEGDELHLSLKLGTLAPLGKHVIRCTHLDPASYTLRTEEYGTLIKDWKHEIKIKPLGRHQCEYADRVDVKAGLLTAHAWGFAQLLYRYRQERLRVLLLIARF